MKAKKFFITMLYVLLVAIMAFAAFSRMLRGCRRLFP